MVAWNDALPSDADRARLLLPLIPVLVGTRGSKALKTRRANMAADWYIRVQTPAWLRLAGLTTQAEALEAFPEIIDFSAVPSLKPTLGAIRQDAAAAWDAARAAAGDAARAAARDAAWAAAWDAARAAAGDAAGAAAWDAARAAAGDAARAAARAARDAAGDAARAAAGDAARAAARAARAAARAAGDAAGAAAWDAARAAAGDAARDALAPTLTALQISAVDLVKRMCALTDKAKGR
jgi:hypothetical protein